MRLGNSIARWASYKPLVVVLAFAWGPSLADGPDTSAPEGSATHELKEAGKHVGHATRIAVEKTKQGLKAAGKKIRDSTKPVRQEADRAAKGISAKTKEVARDVEKRVRGDKEEISRPKSEQPPRGSDEARPPPKP
jgi:hypothetical protein